MVISPGAGRRLITEHLHKRLIYSHNAGLFTESRHGFQPGNRQLLA